MALIKKTFKNIALLVATAAFGMAVMEAGVRFVQPQQLVRAYVLPDGDVGSLNRPSRNFHDFYGNDYWVRTNEGGFAKMTRWTCRLHASARWSSAIHLHSDSG